MTKLTRAQAENIFIKLSWWILEQKFRYYEGSKYNLKPCSDQEYDKKEEMYLKLAKKLGHEPTASSHVGFPAKSLVGEMIFQKLTNGPDYQYCMFHYQKDKTQKVDH